MSLTNLLAANLATFFALKCHGTVLGPQELHEAISLFDRDLRQVAVAMESMEDVSLGHPLGAEVADEQPRSVGELFPSTLADILALVLNKFVIFPLSVCSPRLIVFGQVKPCSDLVFPATLKRGGALHSVQVGAVDGLLILADGGRRVAV